MTTFSSPASDTSPRRASPLPPMPSRASPQRHADPGVLARLAALPAMTMPELQAMWRDLYPTEPPRCNRKFIESRLAYRVQELSFGGLKSETRRRLEALAEECGNGNTAAKRSAPSEQKLLVGTRLLREWQGVEHTVTVLDSGFEWEGRPYASLSSVARAITNTRWNGPLFFGLRSGKGRAA